MTFSILSQRLEFQNFSFYFVEEVTFTEMGDVVEIYKTYFIIFDGKTIIYLN